MQKDCKMADGDLKSSFPDFDADFSLFIEAGFIAVAQKDEPGAAKLFNAAQILRPWDPAPEIGLGYIALNKLEVDKAEVLLNSALKKEPDHLLAKTFLGIAYLLQEPKRKKGEALIKDAMAKTDDEAVVELGKVSLMWADKDLKPSKAPFFAKKSSDE
jgi:Flp pilus assembly protein TadD